MINYKEFKQMLDANRSSILLLLSKEFTSRQFIDAIRALIPNEYAGMLSGRSYKALNVWVSRWYLQGLFESGVIEKIDRKKEVLTENRSKSRNKIWRRKD